MISTMKRLKWLGLIGPLWSAGCGQAVPCGDLAEASPALAEVCTDGVVDCSEGRQRNQYNVCPADQPTPGVDGQGVMWLPDLVFGFLPNPYHVAVQCWRGSSPELGISSYQCCYDETGLVTDGRSAGSFDFVDPFRSPGALFEHFMLDIWLWAVCDGL